MTGHNLQLALREWVEHFNQWTVFVILFGVALVLGVSGPFGTSQTIQLLPRLLYLGGIQHRHLWPWQLCRVFGPADLPASNSGPARHSNPD
ncbi:hypothetical protein N9381_07260 [Paracoccaceae bacterium]|nr:hypothetical protein [Paracoccaceae bacterium]